MNVFGEIGKLIFVDDSNCFVCALEEMANPFMFGVEVKGIFGN